MGSLFMLKIGVMAAAGVYEDSESLLQEGRFELVLGALQTTAEFLQSRFGSVDPADYQYSDLFAAVFTNDVGGALDVGRVAIDGSEGSVNNFLCGFATEGDDAARWDCQFGPVMRIINSFDEDGTRIWPHASETTTQNPPFRRPEGGLGRRCTQPLPHS